MEACSTDRNWVKPVALMHSLMMCSLQQCCTAQDEGFSVRKWSVFGAAASDIHHRALLLTVMDFILAAARGLAAFDFAQSRQHLLNCLCLCVCVSSPCTYVCVFTQCHSFLGQLLQKLYSHTSKQSCQLSASKESVTMANVKVAWVLASRVAAS